jgi:flagellar hook protein FlgE
MLSSMFSGVSGLTAHQVKMDVIGNNIANVNTTAFKSSSVTFSELFSQTVQAATQPTSNRANERAAGGPGRLCGRNLGALQRRKHPKHRLPQRTGHLTA